MTQEAFFRVTDFVTAKVSLGATLSSMLAAVDGMAARGIGLLHSVSGVGFPLDMDVTLESLFARGLRNPFQYRLFFQTMEVDKVLKRKLPRIGGCFATALDGCFGSVDAALNSPYADDEANTGVLYYPQEQVRDFARRANRAGLQIEMHAIGDRAFQQAVDAITGALADFPRTDHRHAIIHACLPTAEGWNPAPGPGSPWPCSRRSCAGTRSRFPIYRRSWASGPGSSPRCGPCAAWASAWRAARTPPARSPTRWPASGRPATTT
jgi:hypothetical protein